MIHGKITKAAPSAVTGPTRLIATSCAPHADIVVLGMGSAMVPPNHAMNVRASNGLMAQKSP